MSQIYRMKLNDQAKLFNYEEKILSRYGQDLLLPLSIVRDESGEYIDYVIDGYVPFERYTFVGLGSVFSVLKSLVEFYISIQRHFLDSSRFFSEKEKILICYKSGRAIPLFGKARSAFDTENIELQNDEEANLILPLVVELSKLNGVVCAKDAMESIYNKIRGTNPGLKDILRIVRDTQREWSLILPTGF